MAIVRRQRRDQLDTKQREIVHHVRGTARARRAQPRVDGLPMLRTSERGTFKRCRWLWWQEFVETRKPISARPPLRFGSLIHLALRDYYKPGLKRGPHPAKSFAKYYEAELQEQLAFGFRVQDIDADEKWAEAGELGEAMMNHYIDRYGKDDEWEVLVTEQPFKQLVYKPWTVDPNYPIAVQQSAEPWFWYTGIIDGVWRNRRTKKIHIVDHKTAKAIMTMYLSLDSQATAYWTWGLDWIYENGLLKPNEKPAGMLYNIMRKAFPDDRPKDDKGYALNQNGAISKKQPAPYFARVPIWRDATERETARDQILAEFADIELLRAVGAEDDGSPPAGAYKNQGQFTCPGCPAFDYCELNEIGADWIEMRELGTKLWNPYEAHEIYAGETK